MQMMKVKAKSQVLLAALQTLYLLQRTRTTLQILEIQDRL